MIVYILRRSAAGLGILLAICALTFVIFFVLPADPAQKACGKACTPERIAQIRTTLGIDRPLPEQFGSYLAGIVAGRTYGSGPLAVDCPAPCLGFSFQTNQPVTQMLTQRLGVSASIAVGAAVLWLLGGVSAGVLSAVRKGTWLDRTAMVAALGGISVPVYMIGLGLQYVLVVKLHWLPYPRSTALADDPVLWLQSMIMPWISLAMIYAGLYARLARSETLDSLGQNFVRTARAKGLPERTVLMRHTLRPAMTPLVTIFGMDLGALLGGALITESVFSLPGIGKLAADAISSTDQPVILGVTLFSAAFIVVANIVVDCVYAVLDPRVRGVQ